MTDGSGPLDTISSVSSLSTCSIRVVHKCICSICRCANLLTTNSKHFVLGSSCGNQKEILHAAYITIICLLLITNLSLIFVVCRMRTRSGKWVFILKTFVLFLILYWPRLLNLLTGDDTGLKSQLISTPS